jgi:transposase
MGVVLMSKRELNRIDVLARLDGGRLTASAAADLMRVTLRQTHRLLKRYREGGAAAIANRRRGRPSNNRLSDVVRVITPSRWSGSTTRTLVRRDWLSVARDPEGPATEKLGPRLLRSVDL